MPTNKSVGLNGLGRFSLRLLRYWFNEKSSGRTNFDIIQINEPYLSPTQIIRAITNDRVIGRFPANIRLNNGNLEIGKYTICLSSEPDPKFIEWNKEIKMILECSGKFTQKKLARQHLHTGIKKALISATSLSADKTIILGFNENEYDPFKHHIVSYGSCTTNCFLPIAKLFHQKKLISSANASVIHATALKDIKKPFGEIRLKPSTLEMAGPKLFPCLRNFYVKYRMVPYPGISLMDIEIKLKSKITPAEANQIIKNAAKRQLKGIVKFEPQSRDSNSYIGSPFSAVVIGDQTRVIGSSVLLAAWFDNENSAARFNDVAKLMASYL